MCNSLVVKDNLQIIYYITDFNQEKRVFFNEISVISDKSFYNKKVERSVEVLIKEKIIIEKSAFENCTLTDFICVNGQERFFNNDFKNLYSHSEIELQYRAFANCENLESLVFPLSKKIIIENETFKNCSNLRTIVLLSDKENESIYIAPDAFDENENLVFVCIKGSVVERYAREHNFRIINVKN